MTYDGDLPCLRKITPIRRGVLPGVRPAPARAGAPSGMPVQAHVGKTCPYCQTPLKPHDQVVVCTECRMPHHQDCWEDNGGCTTFGCHTSAAAATQILPARDATIDLTASLDAAPAPSATAAPPQSVPYSPGPYSRPRRASSPAGAIIATIAIIAFITVIVMVFRGPNSASTVSTPPPPASQENPNPPSPSLEVDGVAGIDTMTLNQYLELTVTAENGGAPVNYGSITISCSGAPQMEILDTDCPSPRIWGPGETVRRCTDVRAALEEMSATEVGGEAYYHHQTWGTGGRRYLRLRITPRQSGTMEIKVRCTLTVAQKERERIEQQIADDYYAQYGQPAAVTIPRYYTVPDQWNSDGEDQQGFPVKIYRIEVQGYAGY
ncbi:MAG: RING finger protein [Armatimonadota bacterium]